MVTLELGSNLNGSSIREGVDVYFECNVQANPWVYKVIWRHNVSSLTYNHYLNKPNGYNSTNTTNTTLYTSLKRITHTAIIY
ncbi:hypothetical protein C0J52_04352 [Blattella germanica]|nr:hypothetical protein C0J52_04352 [Blattella germanica]